MPSIVHFGRYLPRFGYAWSHADELDVDESPTTRWRIRHPWNAQGEDTPRLVLQERHPSVPLKTPRIYPTADDPALFRNFSSMEPTPETLVDFANRCGSLYGLAAEPFSEWEYEIRTMRFLVLLWDAVLKRNLAVIRKYFMPSDKGGFCRPFEDTILAYSPYAFSRGAASRLGYRGVNNLVVAAKDYLLDAMDVRLGAISVNVSMTYKDQRVVIGPHHLLGALWLQFAESVGEQTEYRACEQCGKQFEVTPQVNRSDKIYCSDNCRVKAYQRRRKQAIALRSTGHTLRDIAKKTGAEIKTIKQWLKAKGE